MWARPPCFATLANGGKAPSRLLAKPRSHLRHLFARLSAMKTVVEEIEEHIARVGTHPVYGYAHCLRVFALAEELAALEGVSYDVEILRAAALIFKAWNSPPQASQAVIEATDHLPPGAPTGTASETVLLKDAVGLDYL